MKSLTHILFVTGVTLLLLGCRKQIFLPDPYNPGLSRFTAQRLQTGTCYINDDVYINYWPQSGISIGPAGLPYPTLTKVLDMNGPDSIDFSWQIERKMTGSSIPGIFSRITFRIPVPDGFGSADLVSWNEKKITSGECRLYLDKAGATGTAGIFFVKASQHSDDTLSSSRYQYFAMSGLFEGNLGDSIKISKGRFDFVVKASGF